MLHGTKYTSTLHNKNFKTDYDPLAQGLLEMTVGLVIQKSIL